MLDSHNIYIYKYVSNVNYSTVQNVPQLIHVHTVGITSTSTITDWNMKGKKKCTFSTTKK